MSQNKRKRNNRGNMVILNSENNEVDSKKEEMERRSNRSLPSSNRTQNNSMSKIESSKRSQRDLLIDELNSGQVDCAVCYEKITNDEQIWSCMNCYQIFHLKCVMRWFCKSYYNGNNWKCPACQCEISGKPIYSCFCRHLTNPFSNNIDTPHSCGQVCNRQKKNFSSSFYCKHECTLLCHPGPCPQCEVTVSRNCECGKIQFDVPCSSPPPILCQNICSKLLSCNFHFCGKKCHAGSCDSCKYNCPKENSSNLNDDQVLALQNDPYIAQNVCQQNRNCLPDGVTEEELRMLGIEPLEFINTNQERRDYVNHFFEIDTSDYSGDENFSISTLNRNYRYNMLLTRLNSLVDQHLQDSIESSSSSNELNDYSDDSSINSTLSTNSQDY
ncbi:transcriptional repressor NF-X1-like [Daktulosphaira vitifoliae]|uniref:transcriptional repressor NF-X1-like n=1 Tax=Daktulosphaira vitifoliae TaxID=58002 RepID=UPI0021AA5245|nr:transcriptional repressor NF-X1-like [Daktulosphaira vitifoliae]XP_050534201.1 transcriptional repressor NF-X1-like [Daktulosphaira vitifoliae]XP_050534210.1 transcriptional repressor NF-X1-like [Daktulosphaira vitifoliae]